VGRVKAVLASAGACLVSFAVVGCATTGSGTTATTSVTAAAMVVNPARAELSSDVAELSSAPALPSMNASATPPKEWITVPVYFGTRRNFNNTNKPAEYYGKSDDTLKYGVTTVTIPEHRRPGKTDGRGMCRFAPGRLHCGVNPTNSVTVARVAPKESDKWLQELAAVVDSGGNRVDALVFVHGFNNSFADAMTRAAQLSYDAGFKGVVLSFDWTSRNELLDYMEDETNAERSVPDFGRFLRRVIDSTGARRIAIVAHSMGTRLVSYTVRDLQSAGMQLSLGPVIFAASDIDSAVFIDQYARKVQSTTRLMTLYASTKDRAILASDRLVHHAPRVGSGPPTIISLHGIDYIDASAVDTDLIGHGYFAENKVLIDDIFLILRHEFGATDRNLAEIQAGRQSYFRFR
jgi:esterase/lipase superfamily enzyme